MKKAWLVIRLAVETTFGLIYMTRLLLLPSIYDGSFPQQFFLGYLGMPRRYHASTMDAPGSIGAELQRRDGVHWFARCDVPVPEWPPLVQRCFRDNPKAKNKPS
jgi:hypothetical protein